MGAKSYRFDDFTDWALWLATRRSNWKETAIVKAAIMRQVEHLLTPENHDTHEPTVPRKLMRLWHADPEVRHVLGLFSDAFHLEPEEHETKVLIQEHKDVWFDEEGDVIADNARALHKHLDKLRRLRRESNSRRDVAKAIASYLSEAGKRGKV